MLERQNPPCGFSTKLGNVIHNSLGLRNRDQRGKGRVVSKSIQKRGVELGTPSISRMTKAQDVIQAESAAESEAPGGHRWVSRGGGDPSSLLASCRQCPGRGRPSL